MGSPWREVDALKSANRVRHARAESIATSLRLRNHERTAFNLVWRHFRRLPEELVVAALTGGYEPGEQLASSQKSPPEGQSEVLVAADWLREHGITWKTPVEKVPPKMAAWRPMTEREAEIARTLSGCRFTPASFEKRFARDLGAQAQSTERLISPKQSALLMKLAHRYRRQLAAHGVEAPPAPELAHGG